MIVTDQINIVRHERWGDPAATWGLVPTMGFLHAGHIALVEAARAANDKVAVTIYVNPTQFAPTEDLSSYPRDLERDLNLLEAAGVDLVFTPSNEGMYPAGYQTFVAVEELTRQLEGRSRPTHFRGVTTIVAKLFNIIQPTRAYFGQKDAQQTVVIRQMVGDLNFNVDVVICPTVRERDGLALSSRNKYLSAEQRASAPILNRALTAAAVSAESTTATGEQLRQLMADIITEAPLARIDYLSVANARTLQEIKGKLPAKTPMLLSGAIFFGNTRLIDNTLIQDE